MKQFVILKKEKKKLLYLNVYLMQKKLQLFFNAQKYFVHMIIRVFEYS